MQSMSGRSLSIQGLRSRGQVDTARARLGDPWDVVGTRGAKGGGTLGSHYHSACHSEPELDYSDCNPSLQGTETPGDGCTRGKGVGAAGQPIGFFQMTHVTSGLGAWQTAAPW